mmetsp:Transcript_20066/g.2706  ORF Transcript_20066/g.2706 Transcript_20066/m.2706 type:complete len:105 (+) Transcript_20066:151-465(+)
MNFPRSSPGVCYHDGDIYACGGFEKSDENSSLDTFEKLNLDTNKWVSLRRSNFRASGCTLASFHDRYIFKFGGKSDIFNLSGKIEYYDSKTDEWHIAVLPDITS